MELQQRFTVSMNEYEEGNGDAEVTERDENDVKTEDIYQSLQQPLPTITRTTSVPAERSKWNYMFLLFAVNILISICILAIVGSSSNSSHAKETQPIKGQKEVWLLHDNVFYLFWSDPSDCSAAQSFCSKRNASLATFSEDNKGWLMFKTNGRRFLVSTPSQEGSGDVSSQPEDDEHDCGSTTSDSDHGEGFVCERKAKWNTSQLN